MITSKTLLPSTYLLKTVLKSCPYGAAQCASRNFSSETDSTMVYHAGLRYTQFTSEMHYTKESQVIPIFRVLGHDGNFEGNNEAPWSLEDSKETLRFMIRYSVWDDLFYNIQRQGRISFYIQNAGEEAIQIGMAKALKPADMIFGQYRELGLLLYRGFSLQNALDQCFSNKDEEGKGRQMPISYTDRSHNLQTICTPLTTQVPHAAGAGYAFKLNGEKRAAVVFFGEGASSEGDFHAAMNFGAVMKSQTIYVCRNNGYAISTPVKDQYAGDGIAIRGLAYGMETIRVDGNDIFACYLATKKAREICAEGSEPVLIEFMTYRMGHHSTSDDSSQYRPKGEFEAWSRPGVSPIARLRKYLLNHDLWTKEEEEALRKEAKDEMIEKIKLAETKKKFWIIPGMFDDMYDQRPWNVQEQAKQLKEFLDTYKDKYNLSIYDGVGE